MITEPGQEAVDDVAGAAVALLRAMESGDVAGADAVMASVDPQALAGFLAGLVSQLGPAAFGSRERYIEVLTVWRPGRRIGDPE